jgi:hypothetical protein
MDESDDAESQQLPNFPKAAFAGMTRRDSAAHHSIATPGMAGFSS